MTRRAAPLTDIHYRMRWLAPLTSCRMPPKGEGVLRDPTERSSLVGTETILRHVGTVSRRDFIYLSATLAVFAGTVGCSRPGGAPDERVEFRVLRPEDLLSLHFELRNLRIVDTGRGPPRLVRIDETSDALLVIGFPGQHIAEEVFNEAVSGLDAPISLPVRRQWRNRRGWCFGFRPASTSSS